MTTPTETRVEPTVTLVKRDGRRATFRIEGGTLEPTWAENNVRRGSPVAWCEVSMYLDSDQLGSFGGEVWPSAWPHLFQSVRRWGEPNTLITPAGRALLSAALGEEMIAAIR